MTDFIGAIIDLLQVIGIVLILGYCVVIYEKLKGRI
jgi:hypothetical protein